MYSATLIISSKSIKKKDASVSKLFQEIIQTIDILSQKIMLFSEHILNGSTLQRSPFFSLKDSSNIGSYS